ncbi:hypothetical protein Bpfe_025054 [Biomphalaria pfeifferi]|uniref:Uncharacterized protein n=1 Tax=Biomphalaria pfeifferi TaxID=112525 RepID=A0AAD8B058_BIOPF|nr:hypothetical protein Bpfe_025054 [Biomphalaria pfeifferi]
MGKACGQYLLYLKFILLWMATSRTAKKSLAKARCADARLVSSAAVDSCVISVGFAMILSLSASQENVLPLSSL